MHLLQFCTHSYKVTSYHTDNENGRGSGPTAANVPMLLMSMLTETAKVNGTNSILYFKDNIGFSCYVGRSDSCNTGNSKASAALNRKKKGVVIKTTAIRTQMIETT